jgi:hypothetical protein
VEGNFTVTTSADWILEQLNGAFVIRLDPDVSSQEHSRADVDAITYIKERMKLCPVSRNLPDSVVKRIDLSLAE